ncbi:hypothetical protein OJF2_48010 [Aquisphaera giovannonii]|uniref:Lipoprotein n=1 Tax=Aquisphaera giovannonii TaxID=406548 RepID=A0A5B9W8A9_9BACT|nr:hypothetical protein OJF2_48010 [Aquisphaera giovannonii]
MRYAFSLVAFLTLTGCAGFEGVTRPGAADPAAGAAAARPRESWLSRRLHPDRPRRREPAPATATSPASEDNAARAAAPAAELLLPDGEGERDEPGAGRPWDQPAPDASRPIPEGRPTSGPPTGPAADDAGSETAP